PAEAERPYGILATTRICHIRKYRSCSLRWSLSGLGLQPNALIGPNSRETGRRRERESRHSDVGQRLSHEVPEDDVRPKRRELGEHDEQYTRFRDAETCRVDGIESRRVASFRGRPARARENVGAR